MQTRETTGRLALVLPLIAFVAAMAALATAGSRSTSHTSQASESAAAATSHRSATVLHGTPLRVSSAPFGLLPAVVQDSAVAPTGAGRLAMLGGLGAAQSSSAQITILDEGATAAGGTLPAPQHDAQAAALAGQVYVFGGGALTSFDHILRYDPATHEVSAAGTLPTKASDVAVAALDGTAYIVGGYDGAHPLDTILAWRPDAAPRTVAHLPTGLRYAAVASAGQKLIIAGGTAGASQLLSDAIFSFAPATGALTRIGRLPAPLTHASAAYLDGQVLIVGGRHALNGEQSDAILAVDPATGRVYQAGQLPTPLSDAAVAASAGRIIVAGGQSPAGTQRAITALVAAGGP